MHRAIHQRGWADTRKNILDTFKEDPLVKQLMTRNSTVFFDKSTLTVDEMSKLAYMLTYASYSLHGKTMPTMTHILAVSLGELVAPVLPSTYFLNVERANARVKECVKYLLTHETVVNRGKTREQFIDMYNAVDEELRDPDWEAIDPAVSDEDLLTTQADNYVSYLLTSGHNDMHLPAVELFTTVFVAVAKRGTVTEDFVNKIVQGLSDDMQYNAKLDGDIISMVYKFYGGYINADNAKLVLDTWLEDIPEVALRVRLTLQQATNSGLTAFTVIGRAMKKYPDFPWARLNMLTGGELQAYSAAITVVGGNAYYGFNKTMGAVRSTLYSSIAYVAKELLIQLNGEVSLKRYAGWIKSPKSVTVIRSMIEQYKTSHTDRLESGEVSVNDATIMGQIETLIGGADYADMFA